ncbi:trigger factor [Desulfococcus sp.]|uniref:trigger factor n=1 Tax=Desulfococcus sp. TaxID=2025834 RepID=UPI00359305CC
MEVNVENLSSVKKILHIEVPKDVVNREIDNAYKDLRKTAKIKGFRPGKAPRQVLEQHYRKDVHADVSSKLIQKSFSDAVKSNSMEVIGTPQIDPPELAYDNAYAFDATVEIRPELDTIDFSGITLKKTRYPMTDQEINGQLKALRRNLTRQEKIDEFRPVVTDDFVLIDYEGFKDGQPFEETQRTENFTMKIGSAHIAAALDEAVIGMKPGEARTVSVTFPEDHANEKLKGQEIAFNITLKEIRKEVLPEINDDFAKNFGKFETLEDLKAEIVKNLSQGYEKRTEQELNEQIFTTLLARIDFEVPDSMVDYELEHIVSDAERAFSYHNMSMEEMGMTHEVLREKYRDTALKQVKRHLILGKIIDQEALAVSEEELTRGYENMAQSFRQPAEEIRKFYEATENQERLAYFKHTLLEKKAIELIITRSDIEEVAAELASETEESA